MAYSQATLFKRLRQTLNDTPWYDICTEAMDTTETGLDVADTTYYSVGDVVEFLDDGEQCLVTALASATTLTVQRNHNFSVGATLGTGTSHSISARIAKNPIIQYAQLSQAVEAALQGMYPTVYYVQTQSVSTSDGTYYYNATADALRIIQATQKRVSAEGVDFFNGPRTSYPITLIHYLPVADYPSTKAWYIPRKFNSTYAIEITFAQLIDNTISGGNYSRLDDGLVVEATLMLAAAELAGNLELPRTLDQDTTMADQSVSPGVRVRVAEDFRRRGRTLKQQAAVELAVRAPMIGVWQGVK